MAKSHQDSFRKDVTILYRKYKQNLHNEKVHFLFAFLHTCSAEGNPWDAFWKKRKIVQYINVCVNSKFKNIRIISEIIIPWFALKAGDNNMLLLAQLGAWKAII